MKKRIINSLVIILGDFLLAVGIGLFILPYNIDNGGVTGISVIFNKLFDPAIFISILNWILFFVGWIFCGGSGILCQRHVISCSFAICSPWIYVWQIHLCSCGSVWWHGDYEFDFCIFAILLVDVLSIACGWICCTATVQYVCKQ